MSTWDSQAVDRYYSGQGVVLMGTRDVDGNPQGLFAVGNVSALKISVATTTLEHKESHTGQRGTDLRITTEVKVSASITMENYVAKNLAKALRGLYTLKAGATVTDIAFEGSNYPGAVMAIGEVKLASVVIKQAAAALTVYTDELTAWDYKLNADAGSILINDGASQSYAILGTTVSAVTVGATTSLTVANTAAVGDKVHLRGFTGADMADLNNKAFTIVTASPTVITVNAVTTGHTITVGAGKAVFQSSPLTLTFTATYPDQYLIDALAAAATDTFVRFEGLNTAESLNPVVVEIYRLSSDPLKDLDLISDGIQQFVLEGSVLADNNRQTGSKYFTVTKLN